MPHCPARFRQVPSTPVGQRGNALVFALLALVLMGLAGVSAVQNKKLELKRDAGLAEATVLEALKNAANNAIFDSLADIQQGRAFTRNGVSVVPAEQAGDLVWRPSIAQLRDMGYLPSGWGSSASGLNQAPYDIAFHRVPTGCAPATCAVEGQLVVMDAIRDGGRNSPVDGVVLGPILTRIGADSGVSLATSPQLITGFGNTWSLPNPVPGQPAGVIALRLGTASGGFGNFVRIGDPRDPNLAGNLSVAGNLTIAGSTVLSGPATLTDASGTPCVTLAPTGMVTIACAGQLNARTGVFTDGAGGTTTVSPTGVTASGRLVGADGLRTATATLFDAAEPDTLRVSQGSMFIWGSGGRLVSFDGGDVVAGKNVAGQRLALAESAVEGAACGRTSGAAAGPAVTEYASLVGGGLAVCTAGRWSAGMRSASAGAACATPGAYATDPADQQGLICREGVYMRTAALLSSFVLVQTLSITLTTDAVVVPKPTCAATGGNAAQALIILTGNNEDAAFRAPNVISGINRYALDDGASWRVVLERSADASILPGTMIASVYCYYG